MKSVDFPLTAERNHKATHVVSEHVSVRSHGSYALHICLSVFSVGCLACCLCAELQPSTFPLSASIAVTAHQAPTVSTVESPQPA